MGNCISFGNYNKNYKYMMLFLIFRALNDSICGFGFEDLYENTSIFGADINNFFMNHALINTIFCYIGLIILSIIAYKCEHCFKNKNFDNESPNTSLNSIRLIHNSPKNELVFNETQILLNIFLVTFLWVLEDLLISIILVNILKCNDFWSFKMIFTYLIGKKFFKFQAYRHQIFAIYFISILCSILLIISFIISCLKDDNNLYKNNPGFIPIGILAYLIDLLIESFSNWDAKWLMDSKFISSNKLLMCYGILGFIINSFISAITTLVKCGSYFNYFCKAGKNEKYLDSFEVYFDEFSKEKIIIIILHAITFALKCFFYLLTIKHLTPFHIISMPTIYYFFLHIVLGIYSFAIERETIKNNLLKFILEISTSFLAFLAFSIFLEFIELNFCLFNFDLRKYINRRSVRDSNNNYELDSSMTSEYEN